MMEENNLAETIYNACYSSNPNYRVLDFHDTMIRKINHWIVGGWPRGTWAEEQYIDAYKIERLYYK